MIAAGILAIIGLLLILFGFNTETSSTTIMQQIYGALQYCTGLLICIGVILISAVLQLKPLLKRLTEATKENNQFASCKCDHCDSKLQFERANYDPKAAEIVCPHCSKETELHL